MAECGICANAEDNTPYRVWEMQLGTRQAFDYFQCGQCGCLQIVRPPDNLADYYPSGYFSFRDQQKLARHPLRAWRADLHSSTNFCWSIVDASAADFNTSRLNGRSIHSNK